MKKILLALLAVALLGLPVSAANASIWTISCAVSVTFEFQQPIRLVGTSSNYTVEVSPLVDLDPSSSGGQSCVISTDRTEPTRSTQAFGSGTSSEWSCGAAMGSGSWSQSFKEGGGSLSPPAFSGSHTITGTWNDWVLTVQNPTLQVIGVAHLTSPDDTPSLNECVLIGMNSITMTGVMVIQDP